ncbi:MAG: 1,4-dihydroxy-6-naphthoate synthase [Planctomycetes bacterium]|nr:1,4-dihydroxy-6-naphthoate synthase [Planctomycetota bacterium]
MSARRLRFAFSPCPNDTFAFWAAVHGMVPNPLQLELVPELFDIEALNERALDPALAPPVTKLSLPALARGLDRYAVLPSGSALGFGCGPLVVCRDDAPLRTLADLAGARVAIPGRHTTAFLLLSSLSPCAPGAVVPMRFEQVMPAVARGDCDAGLIIHESRFTYRAHGLRELADLGVLWERATGGPLPLGVIAARRDLPADVFRGLGALLRASVELARRAPERPRAYVRAHSQELAADVCDRHIALYVNDHTVDLGAAGRTAIEQLLARGRAAGLLPAGGSPFREDA